MARRPHPRAGATIAGLKKTGGTFLTYLGELKRAGLIDVNGQILRITDIGVDAAGVEPVPDDPGAVIDYWRPRLRAGARRMLDAVVRHRSIERGALAELVDLDAAGGTFGTYLGDLRRTGLVDTDGGQVRLVDWLQP